MHAGPTNTNVFADTLDALYSDSLPYYRHHLSVFPLPSIEGLVGFPSCTGQASESKCTASGRSLQTMTETLVDISLQKIFKAGRSQQRTTPTPTPERTETDEGCSIPVAPPSPFQRAGAEHPISAVEHIEVNHVYFLFFSFLLSPLPPLSPLPFLSLVCAPFLSLSLSRALSPPSTRARVHPV